MSLHENVEDLTTQLSKEDFHQYIRDCIPASVTHLNLGSCPDTHGKVDNLTLSLITCKALLLEQVEKGTFRSYSLTAQLESLEIGSATKCEVHGDEEESVDEPICLDLSTFTKMLHSDGVTYAYCPSTGVRINLSSNPEIAEFFSNKDPVNYKRMEKGIANVEKFVPDELKEEYCVFFGNQILFHSPDKEAACKKREEYDANHLLTFMYCPL